ncbi:MAG: 30S ribosomal protein S8 [Candidatus Saccharimonadales bacterium]
MSTTSTDPIADMLTRIRNAINVRKQEIQLPHSKVKEAVAKILKENRYIDAVSVEKLDVGKTLKITINTIDTNARISEIVRLSKPGRREYIKAANIPVVKSGRGIVIVSTSQGLMTGATAKKKGVGGELICRVY